MRQLLDWLGLRPAPRGALVDAGIPPESRPVRLLAMDALVTLHLPAFGHLPQTPGTLAARLDDPALMQLGARAAAQQLLDEGHPGSLADWHAFLDVLYADQARLLFIDAAQRRPGVTGIRLHPEPGVDDPGVLALTQQDAYGLGPGGYPCDRVPDNPSPGRRAGMYVRALLAEK
jgi:hypothetical protein